MKARMNTIEYNDRDREFRGVSAFSFPNLTFLCYGKKVDASSSFMKIHEQFI